MGKIAATGDLLIGTDFICSGTHCATDRSSVHRSWLTPVTQRRPPPTVSPRQGPSARGQRWQRATSRGCGTYQAQDKNFVRRKNTNSAPTAKSCCSSQPRMVRQTNCDSTSSRPQKRNPSELMQNRNASNAKQLPQSELLLPTARRFTLFAPSIISSVHRSGPQRNQTTEPTRVDMLSFCNGRKAGL